MAIPVCGMKLELRPPAERDSTDSRVPLVLTYNQFNTGIQQILLDNFEMLLSDPAIDTHNLP